MSNEVPEIADYLAGWMPAWTGCFWCGHSVGEVVSRRHAWPKECQDCGMGARVITHLVPGWHKDMTEDEVVEAGWAPV